MPGTFVSDGKSWRPKMVPLTQLKLSQGQKGEPEAGRLYDVPVLDEKGNPIMRPCPAAVETITKDHGADAKGMDIAPFPEDMQMKELKDSNAATQAAIAAMAESIQTLAKVLSKK